MSAPVTPDDRAEQGRSGGVHDRPRRHPGRAHPIRADVRRLRGRARLTNVCSCSIVCPNPSRRGACERARGGGAPGRRTGRAGRRAHGTARHRCGGPVRRAGHRRRCWPTSGPTSSRSSTHAATRCGRSAGRRTASRCGGRSSTATSGSCPSTSASPRAPQLLKELVNDADVLIESFRPGHLRAVGPGTGRAPRHQSAAGHRALLRATARPGPTARGPASARWPSRSAASPTSTASRTARRRCRRSRSATASPRCSAPSRRCSRCGTATCTAAPGQVIDLAIYEPLFWLLGPAGAGLRPARVRPGPDGQQHRLDRAPQRLPDARRQVAGPVRQLAVDRGTGHAPGRPSGGRRRAVVRATTTGGSSTRRMLDAYIGGWIADHDHGGGARRRSRTGRR